MSAVDENTLEINSLHVREVMAFAPNITKVHFIDTGKLFTKDEFLKWQRERLKKEAKAKAKKRAQEQAKNAPEAPAVETSAETPVEDPSKVAEPA